VARANTLGNNVSLYWTQGGARKTLKYVEAPVSAGTWHTLRVEFKGKDSASFATRATPAVAAGARERPPPPPSSRRR